MTRQTWTTLEQKEWLEARKPRFLEAKQNDTASKAFFPAVSKEFREKWPVPPVTDDEVSKAGSIELASNVKRMKYDKRVREWYHNNTRNLTSNVGGRGVLKIKTKPRVLQAWQAYQALTYESQWKSLVSKEWNKYKEQWESEHPNQKPPKNRFTIMVEFVKDKFANETDEMKARCEELRRTLKEESPVDEELAANIAFQLAIDKIPRTLANFCESIALQTGWHVTILAGGPTPDLDGQIMTYLSHTGTTKHGRTFEKFLGPKEYDDHLLRPFESFLHESFTKEDRDSRSRFKSRNADMDEEANEMEESSEGPEDAEDDNDPEDAEDDNDSEVDEIEKRRERREQKRAEFREYELNRQKNVENVKKKLRAFKEEHLDLIPKNSGPRPAKKAVSKKKDLDKPAGRVQTYQRNLRNNHKSSMMSDPAAHAPASGADMAPFDAITPVELSDAADAALVGKHDLPAGPSTLPSAPVDPTKTAETTLAVRIDDDGKSFTVMSTIPHPDNNAETADADSNAHVHPTTSPSISPSEFPPESEERAGDDVVVGNAADTTSPPHAPPKPQNDEDLPPWLGLMIRYLRQVAEDVAWQDLVTAFVDFEKRGPSNGNLPTKCRPLQVSQWIKSKKKDVTFIVNRRTYGKQFMQWWRTMQPPWRSEGPEDSLVRETPEGENWVVLRKGGTAGIYVVLMGLSWWVKGQHGVRDADAWASVDDLLWVIEQMKKGMAVPMRLSMKRTREDSKDDDDDEGVTQRRKSCRVSQGPEQCDAPPDS